LGEGNLSVCAADFSESPLADPMRRQLRATLARYLSQTKTPPPNEITGAQLDQFFQDVSENEKFLHGERGKDRELPPSKK
jgi:hypothetical protein